MRSEVEIRAALQDALRIREAEIVALWDELNGQLSAGASAQTALQLPCGTVYDLWLLARLRISFGWDRLTWENGPDEIYAINEEVEGRLGNAEEGGDALRVNFPVLVAAMFLDGKEVMVLRYETKRIDCYDFTERCRPCGANWWMVSILVEPSESYAPYYKGYVYVVGYLDEHRAWRPFSLAGQSDLEYFKMVVEAQESLALHRDVSAESFDLMEAFPGVSTSADDEIRALQHELQQARDEGRRPKAMYERLAAAQARYESQIKTRLDEIDRLNAEVTKLCESVVTEKAAILCEELGIRPGAKLAHQHTRETVTVRLVVHGDDVRVETEERSVSGIEAQIRRGEWQTVSPTGSCDRSLARG